jgi:hypothetical protein
VVNNFPVPEEGKANKLRGAVFAIKTDRETKINQVEAEYMNVY